MKGQKNRSANRQAPSLFVRPPERNNTSADLDKVAPVSKRIPLTRQRSATTGLYEGTSAGLPGTTRDNEARRHGSDSNAHDRTDAVWIEMQNTLEEVELNAASGANVFSRDHARALEELRRAQIELASAWGRNEGEDEPLGEEDSKPINKADTSGMLASERAAKVTRHSDSSAGRRGSSGLDKTQLEKETENDIMLARQRRQANDKYFERVNKGVEDVVQRLHEVARRMRDVEELSNDVWSEISSIVDGK